MRLAEPGLLPRPCLAIGWLLCAPLMLTLLAREEHHPLRLMLVAELAPPPWLAIRGRLLAPFMLTLHQPNALQTLVPLGMLSAELRLPPSLAIACLTRARLSCTGSP